MDCWLHPSVAVRPSPIAGHGLFATAAIPAGVVVSRLGGRLVDTGELCALIAAPGPYVDTIAVDEDEHLVLPPGNLNGFGNHSCDPNLWWVDAFALATRRDVAAGDELTNDYATSTFDPAWRMPCACGTACCRGEITGADWRRADLRARYGDHWVPVLLRRISE